MLPVELAVEPDGHERRRYPRVNYGCSGSPLQRWLVRISQAFTTIDAKRGSRVRLPRFLALADQGVVAVVGLEKSTVGGPLRIAGSVTSKYFRCLAPVTFAVSAVGNCRMYVLY